MTNVIPLPRDVCRYGYTKNQALTFLKELADEGDRVFPTQHAYQRMDEREVTFSQVLCVLRRGTLTDGPKLGEQTTWEMRYRADCAGQDVSVVASIDKDQMGNLIAVITVITH